MRCLIRSGIAIVRRSIESSFAGGLAVVVLLLAPTWATGGEFQPDPRAVQWCGAAYRYPQAGWIVLHIEGEPYQRGVQHGRLLAPEIAAETRCLAACASAKAPLDGWKQTRTIVNALFLRGFTREQLEEMKGIADGASSAGARFDGRPIDLLDIASINAPNELESLDAALQATPTGLEGLALTPERNTLSPPANADPPPVSSARPAPPLFADLAGRRRPLRCSAFAATGPATRDGKIVFGHVTMWKLYPAQFYNVWLDVQPNEGHRFVMQTYPGGMHSGMDYSINDAGILMCETTLDQTRFRRDGTPLAARIRQAEQYADSIDRAIESLTKDNSGLSTEEWILGDLKTNEIALLTVGTLQTKLRRSGKQEWIAGAKGFYWSCNNDKDRETRLESVPAMDARPSVAGVFSPSKRDLLWLALFDQRQGAIDGDFARSALNTPGLVTIESVDAKYTTTEQARRLETWASFGPPSGQPTRPSASDLQHYPEMRTLVCNPWVSLHPGAPPKTGADAPPVDVHDWREGEISAPTAKGESESAPPGAAWHGTLLPKTDADIWLAAAFAHYERVVATNLARRHATRHHDGGDADEDALGAALFTYRAMYELGARAGGDTPLAKIHAATRDDHWHKIAIGKGVLLLHGLRGLLGAQEFDRLMDQFGRAHAGLEVTTSQFQAHIEHATGKSWAGFFDPWLNRPGLPRLKLGPCETRQVGDRWTTTATLSRDANGASIAVPVTLETGISGSGKSGSGKSGSGKSEAGKPETGKSETGRGETTGLVILDQERKTIEFSTRARPERVVVDKHGVAAHGDGGPFSILTCEAELDKALILYGTLDDEAANREAGRELQIALRGREQAITVPLKKDSEATADELKQRHLLLVGRPTANRITGRFREALPASFGSQSFVVRGEVYANAESAVLLAAENPLNSRFSLMAIAGLSGAATLQAAHRFEGESLVDAELVALTHNDEPHSVIVAPAELSRSLEH